MQHFTAQEVRDLVGKLAIAQAKNSEEIRESARKTDEILAKNSAEIRESAKKTDEELDKLNKIVKELAVQIGGASKTQGEITEDYFFNCLSETKQVANLKFDEIDRNLKIRFRHNMRGEYDMGVTLYIPDPELNINCQSNI